MRQYRCYRAEGGVLMGRSEFVLRGENISELVGDGSMFVCALSAPASATTYISAAV